MGDDIGYWNLSNNSGAMMGYKTPNIDRIAAEGVRFTDYYGEQSCTAGRAAFITGRCRCHRPHQSGAAWGRSGHPQGGSPPGRTPETPGLRHRSVRQEHLGDKDEFLPPPTVSMNSFGISITSMLKKLQKTRHTPRIRNSANDTAPGA